MGDLGRAVAASMSQALCVADLWRITGCPVRVSWAARQRVVEPGRFVLVALVLIVFRIGAYAPTPFHGFIRAHCAVTPAAGPVTANA